MSNNKTNIENEGKCVNLENLKKLCGVNNYNKELYLLLLSFSNLAFYLFNHNYSEFMLVKFILTSSLTMIILAF